MLMRLLCPKPCWTSIFSVNMDAMRIMVRRKKEKLNGPCQAVPSCDVGANARLLDDHQGDRNDSKDLERAVGQDQGWRAGRTLHAHQRQGRVGDDHDLWR